MVTDRRIDIKEENRKRASYTAAFLIAVLVLLLFGTSYAWYSFTSANINVNAVTGSWCDGLDVSVSRNKSVSSTGGAPVSDYTEANYSEFTVTNNEVFQVTIDLSIVNISMDSELANQYFNYTLVDSDDAVVSTGNFSGVTVGDGASITLKEDISFPNSSSKTYKLYLYILEDANCTVDANGNLVGDCTTQNSMQGKSFSGVVKVTVNSDWCGEQLSDSSLYNLVAATAVRDNISSTYVTSSRGIDFSAISSDTNGKGVYTRWDTAYDSFPVHYYRGNVTDNNVIFGGFCWKIVRTTETGGVKMIYNGTPTEGTCNNTGSNSQIGTKAFNTNYNSPAYVGYMYGEVYGITSRSMSSDTNKYYYGNSVTYSNGQYTLVDTISSNSWSSIYNGGLNSNHYTCFNTDETCEDTIYYVYYTSSSYAYYITLTEGKTVEDAIDEMFNSEDINTTSSAIKGDKDTTGTIDYWYYNNLSSYTLYLEDTVFCNDRSIYNLNGWDPNGGSTTLSLTFGAYGRLSVNKSPSLDCSRDIDKFTQSSSIGNGKLDYPVGLLTTDEVTLAGGVFGSSNTTYYLYTGAFYRLLSPSDFNDNALGFDVSYVGYLSRSGVNGTIGVRPVVSLRPGIGVSGGSGTVSDPYVIDTSS